MRSPRPDVELLGSLGRGSTGAVVRGRLRAPFGDWPAGFEVAVKRLHPELCQDAAARRAFETEARTGADLVHPGLVRVLHYGESDDGPELVMEFVPGRSLREALDEDGALPEPLLRRTGQQVASALAALHGAGLLHGDLKPENIRVGDDGRAVLVDLGFVRPIANDPGAGGPGTARYLPPERLEGGAANEAGELFSLGVVLYEAATGLHPFLRGTAEAALSRSSASLVAAQHAGTNAAVDIDDLIRARFVRPSRLVPRLSPFLDHVLERLCSRNPRERPSARELEALLEEGESSEAWRERLHEEPDATPRTRDASHLTPLVGREDELAALLSAYDHACRAGGDAPGGLVWLSGPAGSGKSRLVSDFAVRARAREHAPLYLYGRCTSFDETRPVAPLVAVLRRYLRLPPATPAGAREIEHLAGLVTPSVQQTLIAALDPEGLTMPAESLGSAYAAWLQAVAREQPVVLFLDDLQRAGAILFTLLSRVFEAALGSPVLLLFGIRDDEEPNDPRAMRSFRRRIAASKTTPIVELRLQPLAREDVEQLVRELFHHTAPQLRLARELWRRSRGSPGLVAEILRDLIAAGHARPSPDGRGLLLTISPEELALPSSLQRTIAERYERLGASERRWIERLSVVGGRIEPEFLTRAFPPTTRAEIDEMLASLVRGGWLVPTGAQYRFARPALREVVYRSLPERRRVNMHAAAAKALAPRPGESMREADAYQRAFHLRRAGHPSTLLRVIRPLLDHAVRRSQIPRVHTLASWGLDALDTLALTPARGRLRVELLERAADAADRLGRRDEERTLLDRLADLDLDPEGDPELAARVYLLHGRYALGTGETGLARSFLKNAAQLAGRGGSRELESDALRRLALVQSQAGELVEARKQARTAARVTRDPRCVALAWLARASIDALEDRHEEGLRTVDRALRLVRRQLDPTPLGILAYGQMLRARLLRSAGLSRRALGSARRALTLAVQAGERRLEAETGARLGTLNLDLGRTQQAEARLREALLVARDIEDRRAETLSTLLLGVLMWEQDDPTAEREVERARRLAEEIGYYRAEAVALAISARIRVLTDRADEALWTSERAVQLLDGHGAELFDRIVITGTRALVLRATGRADDADALVRTLERRVERQAARTSDPDLRRTKRAYGRRLLGSVLSLEGVIWPRQQGPGTV